MNECSFQNAFLHFTSCLHMDGKDLHATRYKHGKHNMQRAPTARLFILFQEQEICICRSAVIETFLTLSSTINIYML